MPINPITGRDWALGGFQGLPQVTTATAVTADADTDLTLAALFGGLVVRSGMSAGKNLTLPDGEDLVNALGNVPDGVAIPLTILNANAGAFAVTLVAGTDGTLFATGTFAVAQSDVANFLVVVDDVSAHTYVVYSMGSSAA